MTIIATFNGLNIVGLPCDLVPRVLAPSSVEFDEQEVVASTVSPFTGQMQTFDWQASWWEATVSFPPMQRWSYDAWSAFLSQCRGELNAFLIGNRKARLPKGTAQGVAVSGLHPLGGPWVSGAGQTGYSVVTGGWLANQTALLLPGDFIQIGYRLYKVLNAAASDGAGASTLAIWPPLRDLPADGAQIIARNCKGLFKLKNNSGNKHSVNPGNYGFAGFAIREAI